MADVTTLDNHRPHMTVRVPSGDVHIIPLKHFEEFIDGRRNVNEIAGADSEDVVRAMINDYLGMFGSLK